jgi:large subunit ribosomal protein L30e
MVKKAEKKTSENINSHLNLVMKSGKYSLGYKGTVKNIRKAKGKK